MKTITLVCEDCGSIVAGNVLERYHRVSCPGPKCEKTLRFSTLPAQEREYLVNNSDRYRIN